MSDLFRTKRNDDVFILSFDRQDNDVNCISEKVIQELDQILDEVRADNSIKGFVFISGKRDQFIVGADIKEFARFTSAEDAEYGATVLGSVFDKLEELKMPTVAAIHGNCLGGGLELSLACTWRVATDADVTSLGLPEIQLGLIPGAGGTQRLPRLVGFQSALDLILTGKRLKAAKAKKIGLVDEVVPLGMLEQVAVQYARKKRSQKGFLGFTSGKLSEDLPRWATDRNPIGRSLMRKKAKEMVDEKTKGFYPASYKALDAVFDGYERRLQDGLKLERKLFGQLYITRESRSLIHLFHATTHCKKNPAKKQLEERVGKEKVSKIGVVGAGLMGMGIATVSADRGIRVRVSDPNKDSIARGLRTARSFFESKLKRRRIKSHDLTIRMGHISPGLSTNGFEDCQVAIEAVFEDLGLKQKILADFENRAISDWIFATNTSAIPVKDIAAKSAHKDRIIGMHFFSPVEKMPLLEIVKTEDTADWVIGRVFQLGQDMGKQVIVVKDGPGFYTTRALAFYLNEAALILTEGARTDLIDGALVDFGFPVGPINLIDEVGIDVGKHVLDTISKSFGDRIEVPDSFPQIEASGRLGRKNGKGFYLYRDGKKAGPDEEIYKLLRSPDAKIVDHDPDEIVDRCLLLFIAESIRCLEEGILDSAYDGDVGAVFGLGFPPFWGGPFKYVDHLSAKVVCERLSQLAEAHGRRFEPPQMLKEMAKTNKKFFDEE
jgi:3-hydroxyacyl-CoA dehydrogenase / enoyl-CoA hydratase / 3-hydroxybutyryl-CoA epimerase